MSTANFACQFAKDTMTKIITGTLKTDNVGKLAKIQLFTQLIISQKFALLDARRELGGTITPPFVQIHVQLVLEIIPPEFV